jgi:hypothetical protein
MNRAVKVVGVAATVAVTGLAGASAAYAQPPPPPGPCGFTLSPPHVVQVDGVAKVTATIAPAGCLAPWNPKYGVACLHLQGGEGRCTQSRGSETAHVFFEPYQPGATYVSSGRGCGAVFTFTTDPNCQALGPINATL